VPKFKRKFRRLKVKSKHVAIYCTVKYMYIVVFNCHGKLKKAENKKLDGNG
jgi:hypothetical protein